MPRPGAALSTVARPGVAASRRKSLRTSAPDRAADNRNVAKMTIEPTPAVSGVSQLFQLLRDGVPRTRAELAKSTGLARSTIAARVDELMRMGLIIPMAETVSTGGRPPSLFALNPSARLVLAADIGASHATARDHRPRRARSSSSTASRSTSRSVPMPVLTWTVENAVAMLERIGRSTKDLAAIGIGVPGPGRALDRPARQPADHAGVGPLRRSRAGCSSTSTCRCSSTTTSTSWRSASAPSRGPASTTSSSSRSRPASAPGVISGGIAAARRAGHRRRHRPRAGRARRRRAVPLRQQGMPRGARLRPGHRPRAARAGRAPPRTATTSSTSSSAATSTRSRPCARPGATSARCSRPA